MLIPLQITFHGTQTSVKVEEKIKKAAEKLERFYDGVISVRAAVSAIQHGQLSGDQYRVRLDVSIPGKELVVNREPGDSTTHRDPLVAVRDAFKAMERMLCGYSEERRRNVKHDAATPHGRVIKLFTDEGYGFIETPNGHETYFHKNSVLNNAFKKLKVGMEVRYVEEKGEKGPQASTVEIVGREARHDERTHLL
ncbi:HPF/RaiA family ribosome-associated protein [Syntrophorhabdus aromaticivorans]|uniref:HPF/RaiA family ribosome-associated protein n=1 Tax=Syntrophorhabdus aromaticivorans TaxID=328301 RepID=A0A971M766_9BACT|nr:HPF/RaiA family ribosome-associated protein [Syntrophorhabdus aromaticivorans]NLW36712.1 HPF/RaiA family ribosome-associated protein [Syntrophorhabdus aromaticivorans]